MISTSVALLAEGVDRNILRSFDNTKSLVALLAEGVDRNELQELLQQDGRGRPPRGGRG